MEAWQEASFSGAFILKRRPFNSDDESPGKRQPPLLARSLHFAPLAFPFGVLNSCSLSCALPETQMEAILRHLLFAMTLLT
jgi:hypothetical protein